MRAFLTAADPKEGGGRAVAGWSELGSLHWNAGVLLTSSGTGLHNLTSLHPFPGGQNGDDKRTPEWLGQLSICLWLGS